MTTEEIKDKVARFIEVEEHSCSPILPTPENVARLCYITEDEAAEALKALGR